MILQEELDIIKEELLKDFSDPFFDKSLLDFLSFGSKLIRSRLAILYLRSQNLELKDDIYKILTAGEIIHNASLLHDDVLDDAQIRRNRTTLSKKFSPKVSILAGDYLIAQAIEKLLSISNFDILEKFKTCTKKMVEAEIRQYFLRGKIPSIQDYIEICKGKTAELFSVILETTASLLSLNINDAKKFGECYGVCFQIKNDLETKSAKLDKNNQIYTAIDILGIENTNNLLDNYKEEMRELIRFFPENIYKKELEDLINLI